MNLDEEDERALAALLAQAERDVSPEVFKEFQEMIERLKDGALFVLPGSAILQQIVTIFNLGRAYEVREARVEQDWGNSR